MVESTTLYDAWNSGKLLSSNIYLVKFYYRYLIKFIHNCMHACSLKTGHTDICIGLSSFPCTKVVIEFSEYVKTAYFANQSTDCR